MKTIFLILQFVYCFFVAAQSQKTTDSAIIISEESLVSLIKKLEKKEMPFYSENEKKHTNNIAPI
jgi:hypothetical protein